jgi:hypothetical protein
MDVVDIAECRRLGYNVMQFTDVSEESSAFIFQVEE